MIDEVVEETEVFVIELICGTVVVPPFGTNRYSRYGIRLNIKRINMIAAAPSMNMNRAFLIILCSSFFCPSLKSEILFCLPVSRVALSSMHMP